MAEHTDEIQHHIQTKRAELGQNFEELENKVKSATDWHNYFEQYPMAMLGLAFGGGMLAAMLLGDRPRTSRPTTEPNDWDRRREFATGRAADSQPSPGDTRTRVTETFDTVKGALIGLATAKVRDLLADAMPGFKEQYENEEKQKGRSTSDTQSYEPKPLTM